MDTTTTPTPHPLRDGNRLQRAYYRWAAPHYARMTPELREQSELIDSYLYTRQGLGAWIGWLCGWAGLAAGLLTALVVAFLFPFPFVCSSIRNFNTLKLCIAFLSDVNWRYLLLNFVRF